MLMEEIVLTSEDSNLKSHYESVIGGFEPASHRETHDILFFSDYFFSISFLEKYKY